MLFSEASFLSSFWQKAIAHLFLSVALLFAIAFLLKRRVDERFPLVFALFAIPLGPPGALTVFVSMLLYLIYVKITAPMADLLANLIPPMKRDPSEIIYERILYHLDDFHPERVPVPFRDIMSFGTYKQKRMAIDKMLRYYEPAFAPILKMGLEDPSSAVKVQAATAIGYIDQKMFAENIQLKTLLDENPDDIEILKTYAEQTESYASTDILDPDRYKKMLKAAIDAYETYLQSEPEDEKAQFALARLFYLNGDFSRSKMILEKALERRFSIESALLMLNVLYNLKEISALQSFANGVKAHLGDKIPPGELSTALKFWSEGVPTNIADMDPFI